jgi:uncharacterized membrane protein
MRKKQVDMLLLFLLFATLLVAFIPKPVSAAQIHGEVYDLSLDRISNVVVEVNTTPNQRVISRDGSYSFSLPIGSYRITAVQYQDNRSFAKAEENVTAVDEGDYVIDLFLYPDLGEEQSILNSTGIITIPDGSNNSVVLILFIIAALVGVAVGLQIFFARFAKRQENKGAASEERKEAGKTASSANGKGGMAEDAGAVPAADHAKAVSAEEQKDKKEKPEAELDDDLKKVLDILKAEGGRTTQKEIRKHIPLSEAKVSLIITEMEVKGMVEKIKKGRGNIIILKRRG